jgi:hypothetical protein
MNFLLREPDAGKPHVRFDERDVETERFAPPRHVSTLPRITSPSAASSLRIRVRRFAVFCEASVPYTEVSHEQEVHCAVVG